MAHTTSRSHYIQTPVIRGAYFYIHEKRAKDGQKQPIPAEKQRYEFVGLIPKTHADPTQCANYKMFSDLAMTAISACADFGGQFPAGGNWPIQNGDDPAKLVKNPWRAGNWIIKFSANFTPRVLVRQNGQDTEIPSRRLGAQELYKSGDYCVASVNAFTYDDKAKGVKFNFEGVLFVGAGEPIGATSRTAAQMFGGSAGMAAPSASPAAAPIPSQSMAPPAPAPQAYAPPAAPVQNYAPAPQTYAPSAAPPAAPVAPQYAAPPPPPMAAPLPPAGLPGLPPLPVR